MEAIIIDESATEEKAIREFSTWLNDNSGGRRLSDIVVLLCWFHVTQTWTRCVGVDIWYYCSCCVSFDLTALQIFEIERDWRVASG